MYLLQIARIAGNCQTLSKLKPGYRVSAPITLGRKSRFSFSAMFGNFADFVNFT
jgi:hypothetical protein